jgi:hypothetical protein
MSLDIVSKSRCGEDHLPKIQLQLGDIKDFMLEEE